MATSWRSRLYAAAAHRRVGEEDWYRTVADAVEEAPSQAAVANVLHTSQANVSRWAARGRKLQAQWEAGASGNQIQALAEQLGLPPSIGRVMASPYEAALRYSRGQLTRDQVVYLLSSWPYRSWNSRTRGEQDDVLATVNGSFDDLIAAHSAGLLDDDLYDEIADALERKAAAPPPTSDPQTELTEHATVYTTLISLEQPAHARR
ncbi:hypothetical protein ABCS02_28140 [Microbacterium sp. X-17]|uniref:hypothetical protein n=1 Tax=Microbacterium sp. X-17 TaxID=3144404 RepID=UPI0031F492AF